MKLIEPLVGERIVIRNYRKSDLEFLTDMWFDEENGKTRQEHMSMTDIKAF